MLFTDADCVGSGSVSYWAAGPFTPRNERPVTCVELWYRYVPESGNWHDGTFTHWIVALSAATLRRTSFCVFSL